MDRFGLFAIFVLLASVVLASVVLASVILAFVIVRSIKQGYDISRPG